MGGACDLCLGIMIELDPEKDSKGKHKNTEAYQDALEHGILSYAGRGLVMLHVTNSGREERIKAGKLKRL